MPRNLANLRTSRARQQEARLDELPKVQLQLALEPSPAATKRSDHVPETAVEAKDAGRRLPIKARPITLARILIADTVGLGKTLEGHS